MGTRPSIRSSPLPTRFSAPSTWGSWKAASRCRYHVIQLPRSAAEPQAGSSGSCLPHNGEGEGLTQRRKGAKAQRPRIASDPVLALRILLSPHSTFDVGRSMFDVRCWTFDVGRSMLDVRCWMFDVGCSAGVVDRHAHQVSAYGARPYAGRRPGKWSLRLNHAEERHPSHPAAAPAASPQTLFSIPQLNDPAVADVPRGQVQRPDPEYPLRLSALAHGQVKLQASVLSRINAQ